MSADDRQVAGTHYRELGVSPWHVVDSWPREQRIGFYRGNALKYVLRMGTKDESPQEISKAIHYLEKLLETLREDPAPSSIYSPIRSSDAVHDQRET
jgi:hypothetical protein